MYFHRTYIIGVGDGLVRIARDLARRDPSDVDWRLGIR